MTDSSPRTQREQHRGLVVRGGLACLFGVLAIAWPGLTLGAAVVVFAGYALVDGVTNLWTGLFGRQRRGVNLELVAMGVLGIAAAVAVLVWPRITVSVLLLVIAFWALVVGIGTVLDAWRQRQSRRAAWVAVAGGVLLVLMGALLVLRPDTGARALMTLVGVFALVWGVALLAAAASLYADRTGFGGGPTAT